MSYQLPMAVCAVTGEVLSTLKSHSKLEKLFEIAGATGPPPNQPHSEKWKFWLYQTGRDQNADSLSVLGTVIEEFLDCPPAFNSGEFNSWKCQRDKLLAVLNEHHLQYFSGGRVLPEGQIVTTNFSTRPLVNDGVPPENLEKLLTTLICQLPRAISPLELRRKGLQPLTFDSEYDIQDLFHALLRPWVKDIRPEEPSPSLAGTAARMDFLLPMHRLVVEIKRVRDKSHAKNIHTELLLDFEYYRQSSKCDRLWCVVYDRNCYIENPTGFVADLETDRIIDNKRIDVRVFVI